MDTESLQKAAAQLAEAFQQLGVTLKEMADTISEVFSRLFKKDEEKKIKKNSPKNYGMSLISCNHHKNRPYNYHYIPTVRKNLPYQRRRF